jgi:ectoine hydroxylase-related dioxygenase (phytanoyl-CoA dioxygenase family)
LSLLNGLSPEELDFYRCYGYLVPRFSLAEADIQNLQHLTVQLIADNPEVRGGVRSPHLFDKSSRNGAAKPNWLDIATHPKLLDILEPLIGNDIILWASTLFYKRPLEDGTPWHRDGRYYPIRPLATITAWIAVFDTVREDAALRIIPGSHIHRPPDADTVEEPGSDGRLHLSAAEQSNAVDVELAAGQIVIFDVSTIHGSWPNLGTKGRAGYAVRYFPATSHYERGRTGRLARDRELILVRGQDRAQNTFLPVPPSV